ncbi:MAG: hypothetical protein ACOCZ5_00625 [bacterium]
MMIKVIYTGSYPTACAGVLIIKRNDIEVYKTDDYSFHSTGRVWIDKYYNEHVEEGKLLFNADDKNKFDKWLITQPDAIEIKSKVYETLSDVCVCCGGCV